MPWRSPTAAARGEAAALAATTDWSRTPLGPVEGWAAELRAAVDMGLSTRFPVLITWGDDLTMIYNDAYRELMGDKHPAMGASTQVVWRETWPEIEPYFHRVLETGEPAWLVDTPLHMDRHGYLEEATFTWCYSALRDDDGVVRGVLDIAYETTEHVVDRRRLSTATALASALQGVTGDLRAVGLAAVQSFTDSPDVSAGELYLLGPEGPQPLALTREYLSEPVDEALLVAVARTMTPRLTGHRLVAPLAGARDRTAAGAIVLEGTSLRPMDAGHEDFLLLLARLVGTEISSVRRHLDEVSALRTVNTALQDAMLPVLEDAHGVEVRYLPASGDLEVGGDWYDVVDLGPGRRALVVGDCVGHGLEAAARMGQLRSAARALLLTGAGPAATLAGLDRFASTLPGAECTTVVCGVVDDASGTLTYSSAGHPPPVVLGATGTELLTDAVAPPLATSLRPRPEATRTLEAGDLLLLYTDGLVERRGEHLGVGIERLRSTLTAAAAEPGHLVDGLLAGMLSAGSADDVAVVLYHHRAEAAGARLDRDGAAAARS